MQTPRADSNAKRIPFVREVTPEVIALAGGTGSNRGTGGMRTKVSAAAIANEAGICCCVMSGANPKNLYHLSMASRLGQFSALESSKIKSGTVPGIKRWIS